MDFDEIALQWWSVTQGAFDQILVAILDHDTDQRTL